MKVALVYDRVNKWGGAESVLLALHEIFPNAPLFTSVYDPKGAPWADNFKIKTSFLQLLPLPKGSHEYYPFLMGPAFERFNFDKFDVVISVTHEFAKAIRTNKKTLHICYCLTPTSYLWSGFDQYFSAKSKLFKLLSLPMILYLRFYDVFAATQPDHYIAISETVKQRIDKYYQQKSEVIYPPVTLAKKSEPSKSKSNYFLIVSRLVPNKRIDVAIKSFNHLGWNLKIVGAGRDLNRLKKLSKKNIEFLGQVSESEKWELYSGAKAVIIPGEEDFGLVAVEAQSAGAPIVAFGSGGVTETVIDGKTGWFFQEQTTQSLIKLLKETDFSKVDKSLSRKNARRFSTIVFRQKFVRRVNQLWQDWKKDYAI